MKIAVVGLGFAGLRTMQLLEEAGHTVIGYEARERIGGRCHTVREGDVIYEAGGEWIDGDHQRVLDLMRRYGQEPLATPSSPRRLIFQGKESDWDELWGNPEIRADIDRFEARVASEIGKLAEPDSNLQQLIDESTFTEAGRWYLTAMYRSDEGDDLDRIGWNGWFRAYENYVDREGGELSAFRFPRGASDILERIAAEIHGPMHLSRPVTELTTSATGVHLVSAGETTEFDAVVVTVPGTALPNLRVPNEISESPLAQIPLARAIKITFLFRDCWWQRQGWNGSLMYDGPLQQLWDGGFGEAAVLQAYVTGAEAEKWVTRPDGSQAATDALFHQFPEAKESHIETRINDWIGDPWAGGAFSYMPAGFPSEWPVTFGRIYWAGETTAKWNGFIEGALESAERVAKEIEACQNHSRP
jgi:monoamine oxidase